jgi:hypothetical protein
MPCHSTTAAFARGLKAIFRKGVQMIRTIQTALLAGLACLAVTITPVSAAPRSGKFCVVRPDKTYDMLLVRPRSDGGLDFAVDYWTNEGSFFGVEGTAAKAVKGWEMQSDLNAADSTQRCAVVIRPAGGGYNVSTVEGARCESLAGHNAVLYGTLTFPARTRVGPAPANVSNANLQSIGCP